MKNRMMASFSILLLIGAAKASFSAGATDEVQQLNQQIQAQLKQMQTTQAQQIQILNQHVAKQMKQMQEQLQTMNTQIQSQMKQMKNTLEQDIRQVQEQSLKLH